MVAPFYSYTLLFLNIYIKFSSDVHNNEQKYIYLGHRIQACDKCCIQVFTNEFYMQMRWSALKLLDYKMNILNNVEVFSL